jgi:hypothetical protein
VSKKSTDLTAKAKKYLTAKESGKRGYERADRLLAEIAKHAKPGAEIALNEAGRKAILIDRFEDKDIVWTPCGARRWELKIIEP